MPAVTEIHQALLSTTALAKFEGKIVILLRNLNCSGIKSIELLAKIQRAGALTMANPFLPQPPLIPVSYPTRFELVTGAYLWDEIARVYLIEYAFVGTVAARLWEKAEDPTLHEMEILVSPDTLAINLGRQLGRALEQPQNHTILKILNGTNQFAIVVDGASRVIPLTFIAAGSDFYPNQLIPPLGQFRRAWHGNQPANVAFLTLAENWGEVYRRDVPHVSFQRLLSQRLCRFEPAADDQETQVRNRRDIHDICILVRATSTQQAQPLDPQAALILRPIVQEWVNFAFDNFISRNDLMEMVQEFNRLLRCVG